jgi:hypothetical protein
MDTASMLVTLRLRPIDFTIISLLLFSFIYCIIIKHRSLPGLKKDLEGFPQGL